MFSKKQLRTASIGMILATVTVALAVPPYAIGQELDDETCLGCHDNDASLARGPHRLSSEVPRSSSQVACISCHAGGEVHIEDPLEENITNPADLRGQEAAKTCTQCHPAHGELDNYGFDVHSTLELNCSSCHQVHSESGEGLLSEEPSFCFGCHADTKSSFRRRSNHPLFQGNVTCLSCHRFARRTDHNHAYDFNRVCQDCHPEQGGPFPYEHAVTNAYALEGSGCMECHRAHGSENDHLLKQRGSEVCLQCHVAPLGHEIRHAGVAADRSCYSCHTGIHGSVLSRNFLDPAMPAIVNSALNCYDVGCHDLAE